MPRPRVPVLAATDPIRTKHVMHRIQSSRQGLYGTVTGRADYGVIYFLPLPLSVSSLSRD
ncbi:hypothetical protein B0H14DRAFT_3432456 [Mycena olivaceomarginata]|nr:hypothetical protein B0H14DRAFT_3432456 [Mycena olivaceomarginata]